MGCYPAAFSPADSTPWGDHRRLGGVASFAENLDARNAVQLAN
jgi:hypothetical protein